MPDPRLTANVLRYMATVARRYLPPGVSLVQVGIEPHPDPAACHGQPNATEALTVTFREDLTGRTGVVYFGVDPAIGMDSDPVQALDRSVSFLGQLPELLPRFVRQALQAEPTVPYLGSKTPQR